MLLDSGATTWRFSRSQAAPGDVTFSFFDTRIAALGIARSYCYESPKPTEFGGAGACWGAIGWKVDVGEGLQSVYLTAVSTASKKRSVKIAGWEKPNGRRWFRHDVGRVSFGPMFRSSSGPAA
jgi:hypothetical protein